MTFRNTIDSGTKHWRCANHLRESLIKCGSDWCFPSETVDTAAVWRTKQKQVDNLHRERHNLEICINCHPASPHKSSSKTREDFQDHCNHNRPRLRSSPISPLESETIEIHISINICLDRSSVMDRDCSAAYDRVIKWPSIPCVIIMRFSRSDSAWMPKTAAASRTLRILGLCTISSGVLQRRLVEL
jgi:hypothetical protein